LDRYPTALGSGLHQIGLDANPAEIVYEVMTNADWGMTRTNNEFEIDTFLACAATLHAEGLGASYKWGGLSSYDDLLQMFLGHMEASLFSSARTGQFVLKLVRDDYDLATLLRLHPGNVEALTSFTRGAYDETTNEVKITYTSREKEYTESTAIAQDLANWRMQERVVSSTQSMPALYDDELAAKMAQRDLKSQTYPLALAELQANRQAASLQLSDVFILDWPELGISNLVCRVSKIGYGTLEDGGITINAVQDVFSLGDAIYAASPKSAWQGAALAPTQPPYQTLEEAPHFAVYTLLGAATDPYTVDSSNGRYLPFMARPAGGMSYTLYDRVSPEPYELADGGILFHDHALVETPVQPWDTSIRLRNLSGPSVADLSVLTQSQANREVGLNLGWVGGEWISFGAVTYLGDGVWQLIDVWRGVLDTTPPADDHAEGLTVWLIPDGQYLREFSHPEGVTVDAKVTARTVHGTYDLDDAVTLSVPMAARSLRPYPPGNVRVNGVAWPTDYLGASVTLTWSHRDRLNSPLTVRRQTDATNYGPEAGTTYTLRIFDGSGTLLRTETDLTGTTYTYAEADELSDTGSGLSPVLVFQLESVRDGYTSWDVQERTVLRDPVIGYGTHYGQHYGGSSLETVVFSPSSVGLSGGSFDGSWLVQVVFSPATATLAGKTFLDGATDTLVFTTAEWTMQGYGFSEFSGVTFNAAQLTYGKRTFTIAGGSHPGTFDTGSYDTDIFDTDPSV
jgi:hypothetical protein